MKRAEIILAETRKKRKKDTLTEVRRKRNALAEMTSRVSDETGTLADNAITGTVAISESAVSAAGNLAQGGGETNEHDSNAVDAGKRTITAEKRVAEVPMRQGKKILTRGTGKKLAVLFSRRKPARNGVFTVDKEVAKARKVKQKMRKAAMQSIKRSELMARNIYRGVKATTRGIILMVKLAAKSIMALFTALLANLSTIIIAVVVTVVVVVSVVSALIPSWMKDEWHLTRSNTENYYVSGMTLTEYIQERTDSWRETVLMENTEGAWYVVLHGNGRTEFEPDWDGCLAEFDEWLDGKYVPGEEIQPEDVQVLDGLLAKYSDYVAQIEYFDFYEFEISGYDGVFDIRDSFAKEIVGSREWYDDLDYMCAFWDVEVDGEMKLQAPAVVVWLK